MRRTGPCRAALTWLCILSLPLLTLAQSPDHQPVIPAAEAASTSPALVSTADLPDAPQSQPQQPAQKQNPSAPSLGDLGFTPAQTQANAQLQARLNRRTHMLKVHQTLGLITVAPLLATVISSAGATPKKNPVPGGPPIEPGAGVDVHAALGSLTAGMYFATAYYAIRAPKVPGVEPKGAIRLHRDLVWIHAPGMVLTPVLGAMALNQENQGEKPHGIASAHAYVAWTTVIAYGASIVAVSWPIHLKFWEKK